jgi:hypothetical protein
MRPLLLARGRDAWATILVDKAQMRTLSDSRQKTIMYLSAPEDDEHEGKPVRFRLVYSGPLLATQGDERSGQAEGPAWPSHFRLLPLRSARFCLSATKRSAGQSPRRARN